MTQIPTPPQAPGPIGPLPELPGATAGLVLGICSIVFSAPIVGLILGFLGLQKSRAAKQTAAMNPGIYANAGIAQAGYVCSIIGLILGAIMTLCGCGYFIIIMVAIVGGAAGGGFSP
ncbi:MAG: hypothetical protein IH889_03575 [Planctomycetes bacterium]|nr:hypothetical protein [Planctomycetota bacterium]